MVPDRCGSGGAAPLLQDPAVEHVDDAAGEVGMRRRVGDHDDGRAFLVELAEHPHHLLAVGGVEVAGRLVGEDQLGLADQRAGDGDALLLATRQLGRAVLGAVGDADLVEHLVDARLALARAGMLW